MCCRVILRESLATRMQGPFLRRPCPGLTATWVWGGCLNTIGVLCRGRMGIIDTVTVQGAVYKYDLQSFTMFQNLIYDISNTHLNPMRL